MVITNFARHYLRSKAADLMEYQGRIFTPGKGKVVYDPVSRKSTVKAAGDIKYEGKMRYWEISAGSKATIGEREYTVSQSWVSIPYYARNADGGAVLPESDDIVQILGSGGAGEDPSLVGRYMRIISVVRGGGIRSSRKMLVEFIDFEEAGY